MSISVIIPAYKARKYLPECLESIGGQTLQPAEVLVIDDASPEPVDDIVAGFSSREGYPPVRLIIHEKNQGLGGARNTGIREASGEWIALLDHDDLWAPDHLKSLVATVEAHAADVAFCSVKQFREDPEDALPHWGPLASEDFSNLAVKLYFRCFITPSATLIRRSLLLTHGGFNDDPRVHMCEDLDLWLRLIESGARFAYADSPTGYYRQHAEAATSRPGYMACQAAFVRELHAGKIKGYWFKKRSAIARRWWRAWLIFLTLGTFRADLLFKAIRSSVTVPWEIARGLVRLQRVLRKKKVEFGEN